MLILAGTVLILSFLLAAFSITQLSSQEAKVSQGKEDDLAHLFYETRDELASGLSAFALSTTDNATLFDAFEQQRVEFEARGRGHGTFVVLGLANVTDGHATKTEARNFTNGGASPVCGTANYVARSYNASRDYGAVPWDCVDDGLLWDGATARPTGLIVYLFMANSKARLEEDFVLAIN